MTTKDNGETQDKELLERYRRASATEASAPSEAVRAAILAESRRVAAQLAQQGPNAKQESRPAFDTSRPAANDSRWKITAFGTLGAALLAALLIAPRYWETLPASKESAAAPPAAPTPKAESVAPVAASDALRAKVVTSAKRRQGDAPAEAAANTTAVPPKDLRLSNAPAPVSAPSAAALPPATNAIKPYSSAQDSAPTREEKTPLTPSPFPAERNTLGSVVGGRPTGQLQSAAESGNAMLASKLLDQGAAVNARDPQGRTPLMLATVQGRLEVVRLLLQRGADPNIADYSGKTPLQQATDRNLNDIAESLRGAGAH